MSAEPKPRTVLLTGATGQLGRATHPHLEESNWTVTGTGLSRAQPPLVRLDLQSADEVSTLLSDLRPRVVIHAAAERSPDKCSANPEQVKKLNVEATRRLAEECQKNGSLLVYVSTDYVFPGKEGEAPYEADAPTNPPNFYGETKREGEVEVLKRGGVVLRVPVLYGKTEWNGESAVNTLLDVVMNEAQKEKVEMDAWSIRYPTNTADVGRVLKDIAEKYTTDPHPENLPRILQFSAEERMTKYEICQTLGELLGVPTGHIVPNTSNDPNSSVVRPYDCHLSTKALKDIGIDVKCVPFAIWWQRHLGAFKH